MRRGHCLVLGTALSLGCSRTQRAPDPTPRATASSHPAPSSTPAISLETLPKEPACPPDTALVKGGDFWVGSAESEHMSDDESPRFLTRVVDFCADVTEVTVRRYNECVARCACTKARSKHVLCNGSHADRAEHPINCVDFSQAAAFCKASGARLPTEVEWEYMARGGSQYLRYPWGEGSPDGRACWKHPGTCPVKSFAPGVYGLFDVSGNVWEWTDSWYGAYPWPPQLGFSKVYRGGSFSRRFEKWMHTRLRNRSDPDEWGSHLGFRCVTNLPGAHCAFGQDSDGNCLHGVLDRECQRPLVFNGARCAEPGAPRCRPGRVEKAGFGCVLEDEKAPEARDLEAEAVHVTRERSPDFDEDCRTNQPARPRAYRYSGSSHEARNLVSRRAGCKNRDVGVGWNSACCP